MKKSLEESELHQRIKELRKKNKLTQKEMADRMGMSRSMYARLESGLSSSLPYLDTIAGIIGEEVKDVFPYDINLYTNHSLLMDILMFGAEYEDVAKKFGMKASKLKRMVFDPKKKYLLQYQEEIDELFPDLEKIGNGKLGILGQNSVTIDMDGKTYIFLNVAGNKKKDTITDFVNF